jgi:parallel beta-helix repeat protein
VIDGSQNGDGIRINTEIAFIQNFTIQNCSGHGIIVNENNSCKLINNLITMNKLHGVRIHEYSEMSWIYYNIISHNEEDGIWLDGYHNLAYNNLIVNNSGAGITVINHQYVSNNRIMYNGFPGVMVSGVENHIFDNYLKSNGLTEYFYCEIYLNVKNHNRIMNNTIEQGNIGIVFEHECSYNNISYNKIRDCNTGMFIINSEENTFYGNIITNCGDGISLYAASNRNIVARNSFLNNSFGIDITGSLLNKIIQNTFMNNTKHGFFIFSFLNKWDSNYWGRPRLLPYPIVGIIGINFDWHPAQEPYEIGNV